MSEQQYLPPIEDLQAVVCAECRVSIEDATQSFTGFGTVSCPHCQDPFTLFRKIKDSRTGPYGCSMEAMCLRCAAARRECVFCEVGLG